MMSHNGAAKKRILYVEQWPGVGGSVTNVLYPMVKDLDRTQYEPIVLFYWPHPYQEHFEALGVKTMVFAEAKPYEHAAPIATLQKNNLVKSLQGRQGYASDLYHALGSYVRVSYYTPQIMKLARLMKTEQIDLVHLNSDPTWHGREVVLAARWAGLPCLCYAQNFSEFQAVDRQMARFIERYVFCSNAIGEHCLKFGGASSVKSCTIYPGVPEAAKWTQPYDTAQLRRELGWSEQDFVVGNIGRIIEWKGQDVFLRALALVKQEVPQIKGLIVGGPTDKSSKQNGQPPSFYETLLALTESLNLTENVHFTGFRSDIPQLLASLDIFVHSSSEPEPFATAVIEAMMAGRPVVAAKAGGMPEMIQNQVQGLLATRNDPQAMAEAILFYYKNPALAKQMALAGQRKATTELTAQRHIQEFHDLYQVMLPDDKLVVTQMAGVGR